MSNEILAGIFILLNLLDAITTLIFMHQKGGKELNPFMNWSMRKIGVVPTLVIKMILACVVAYLTLTHAWALIVGNVLYVLVVINNIIVIKHLNK